MTFPIVYPYVNTQVFTDSAGGRYQGDWELKAMNSVLTDTVTANQNKVGVVDSQGRVAGLLPLLARTATPTAYTMYARGATGLAVVVNATAVTSTPSVVVTIDGYNAATATWTNILTSAAIATISTVRLVIAPGIATVANVSLNSVIPDTIRVVCTHGNANSITYSVDLDWMP